MSENYEVVGTPTMAEAAYLALRNSPVDGPIFLLAKAEAERLAKAELDANILRVECKIHQATLRPNLFAMLSALQCWERADRLHVAVCAIVRPGAGT